jgi:hypothetical protein
MILTKYGFFAASEKIVKAIETLADCAGGRFAAIMGYIPVSKDWIDPPCYDATFTSRFSVEKLYARKLEAIKNLTFEDIVSTNLEGKLAELSREALIELFNARKELEIASLLRIRADTTAHREGQARCHATAEDGLPHGVRVHYLTQRGADNLMHPVLVNGLPIAESIRIHAIEQSRIYKKKGVRKPVNSGLSKLMGDAINSLLNKRSVSMSSFTLKDNFEELRIDGNSIMAE